MLHEMINLTKKCNESKSTCEFICETPFHMCKISPLLLYYMCDKFMWYRHFQICEMQEITCENAVCKNSWKRFHRYQMWVIFQMWQIHIRDTDMLIFRYFTWNVTSCIRHKFTYRQVCETEISHVKNVHISTVGFGHFRFERIHMIQTHGIFGYVTCKM